MSVAEIAEVLDVSEGTVKTALFEGRRKIAALLALEEASDDDC
jgi:DNA-directed RNA polymerase specialized sigma24 family protein